MDFATFIGLIGGIATILTAVLVGSDLSIFVNVPSILIVLGGTLAATLIKFPFKHVLSAVRVAIIAFREMPDKPADLIRQANELATIARSERGLLGLQDEPIANAFFQKGIQLAVDGRPPEFVREVLMQDLQRSFERHETGQHIFRAIGESAPAFGMIGTLIGLVQMLVNMQEPSSIGPAMAVALLTTLYGALIAQLIALPIADKLELRGQQERTNKLLIISSITSIQRGQNPRIMDELLESYLPRRERERLFEGLQPSGSPADEGG